LRNLFQEEPISRDIGNEKQMREWPNASVQHRVLKLSILADIIDHSNFSPKAAAARPSLPTVTPALDNFTSRQGSVQRVGDATGLAIGEFEYRVATLALVQTLCPPIVRGLQ
jgi:hypothetical protein